MTSHAIIPPKRILRWSYRIVYCECGAAVGTVWGSGAGTVTVGYPEERQNVQYPSRAAALRAAEARHRYQVEAAS
ncbi:MAG: hypothetical protein KIT69_09460 [Propionibacteriaceae bacterium]|nr:hypothetical protein [Propionibacteriaceae bacterium]